jgi:aminopeptidase
MPDRIPSGSPTRAHAHVSSILASAIEHDPARSVAVVVADARSPLSRLLAAAYREALPSALHLDFDALTPAEILAAFVPLAPGDLVVLIQSSNFRLAEFRLRVELFARGLKVVEHPHLERMEGPEIPLYVEALAYDPAYYRGTGEGLRTRIDAARRCSIETGAEAPLVWDGAFAPAKLNVGDYRGMRNVGGLYPIGEVFTEAADLEAVNGMARVDIFADLDFRAHVPVIPVTLIIEKGRVADVRDATPEALSVLERIRADEGEVWVRELGFGLNRAFGPGRIVRDIGTLERMCGVHLSLGAKHAVYKKPAFSRRSGPGRSGNPGTGPSGAGGTADPPRPGPVQARHHVDVFLAAPRVRLDGEVVFQGGAWTL